MVRQQLRSAQESAENPPVIYFSGIAGFGLDAETNRRANRMPGWFAATAVISWPRWERSPIMFRRWCAFTAMTPAGRRLV